MFYAISQEQPKNKPKSSAPKRIKNIKPHLFATEELSFFMRTAACATSNPSNQQFTKIYN
jgi:hypothetical protein